jgi:hypothetical protein
MGGKGGVRFWLGEVGFVVLVGGWMDGWVGGWVGGALLGGRV